MTALIWAANRGRVAVVELLLAAGAQINHRDRVRVPPPPRARRALSRSRPPAPSRARERAPPKLEGRARFGSRDPLGERAAPRRESEREKPPPRFTPALFADDVARARVARAGWDAPSAHGSTGRPA